MTILRGAVRIIAAVTGLLVVYGTVFALEGMTTRIPIAAARELALASLWIAPWMLLFCSGLEDLAIVTGEHSVLWLGGVAALLFLYYFDWHTSMSLLTKAAMPLLAVATGLVPHFLKQIRFLFGLSSIAAGVGGAFVLYLVANTLLSPTTHFANKFIGLLIAAFAWPQLSQGFLPFWTFTANFRIAFTHDCGNIAVTLIDHISWGQNV